MVCDGARVVPNAACSTDEPTFFGAMFMRNWRATIAKKMPGEKYKAAGAAGQQPAWNAAGQRYTMRQDQTDCKIVAYDLGSFSQRQREGGGNSTNG